MKKSNRILFIVIAFMAFSCATSQAQIVMNTHRNFVFGEEGQFFSRTPNSLSVSANKKAEMNFNKLYSKASGAEWSALKDNTLLCRFSMNEILYRAFYTTNGKWIATISGYDGAHLHREVYNQVKRIYYDARIVFVNQIDQADAKPVYVVELRDEKSIKKVRVQGDDMEELSEFINP